MVRSERIQEYIFQAFTVLGSTISNTYSVYPLNGDIVKIIVQNPTSPGSIFIQESGTNVNIFNQNNITSGTSTFVYYPFVYGVDNVAAAGSAIAVKQVVNNVLMFIGSGFTSGTDKTFGPVTVYYR